MNKEEIVKNYKNNDDKLLVSKMLDQIDLCSKRNKMQNTDFLDERQKNILQKALNRMKIENYIVFGGFEEAGRNVYIFYPEKWNIEIAKQNYDEVMKIIEVILPNELHGKYTHKDYLGGLMKLGLKREKIGDIIVWNEGAHIIVLNEIVQFLEQNLTTLTRFQKAQIKVKPIKYLHSCNIQKEKIEIIVSSMRLDNIISELIKTSRAKAEEIISEQRVLVNYEIVEKVSKSINIGDKITIRGKGKFEIEEQIGNTKKGRTILLVEKYV